MTSNTIVSLNKIRFHPKSDSKRRPRLCPFRETKFLIFRDEEKRNMQRFSSRIRAFERKRDSSLSLSLSLSLCYKSISNAVRVAKHKKKRSQRTSLSSSKSSFSVTLRTKNAKRERETNTNPKHISNTLNKKKLQLICSQSALTLPSDWRSSEHHANESFFPRATCIIARQWERAFWWILAAERFLFESI